MKHNKLQISVMLIFSFIVSLPFVVQAESVIQLPQTGQTTCYDANGNGIPCPGTGQDGEVQAGAAWPSPRFTPGSGAESDCMIDNLTGLMWPKNADLPNGKLIWNDAIDYPQTLTLCGHSDWRLPNINELESLWNASQDYPAYWLYYEGFANLKSGAFDTYGSSTTFAYSSDTAWSVYMGYGWSGMNRKDESCYVWPVRSTGTGPPGNTLVWSTGQTASYRAGDDGDLEQGASWPSPRFSDEDNGEVLDNLTGLVWTKDTNAPGPSACNPNELKNWQGALNHIHCLNTQSYLGHNDWRLPNIKELRSVSDFSRIDPALPFGHPFINVQSWYYWSASSLTKNPGSAWAVSMMNGRWESLVKSSNSFSVWPVRAGQVKPIVALTITKTGEGSGSVSTDIGTFAWNGNVGTATYYYGTPVNLTAQPGAGSIFSGWSGGGCQGTETCTVLLNANTSVTADFTKEPIGKGDFNYDGQVNLTDAVLALQVVADMLPEQTIYKEAEVNNDGKIGLLEGVVILQKVSGLRSLSIQSSALSNSNPIPLKYTCDGVNVSPPISWQFAPEGTLSFVLIMDDPDAPGGTWDHWIVYNIPASIKSLPENTGASGSGNLPLGASHATNSWNNTYYQGPCPPSGTHRYFFKLYSLSVEKLNPTGTSKAEIEAAMAGKILDQAELMGTYAR